RADAPSSRLFVISVTFRHSRGNGNLEPLNLQITFEYFLHPEGLDSRLCGNDGGGRCRLKPDKTLNAV
ncbi:TPA: hypothetical protein ACFMV8_000154, partial [Neisseria lactamica]